MDFRAQTLSTPAQLEWAARLDVPSLRRPESVIVAGMGGSGIAGNFAAVLADQAGRRLDVVKGYSLPGWAQSERPLLVAVSYSGNTEETLAVVDSALAGGIEVVGISSGGALAERDLAGHVSIPGGNQPRSCLGYLLGALCRILTGCRFLPAPDLDEAAAVVSEVLEREQAAATAIAGRLAGRVPIIWAGSPLTGAVAQRWKTQINENAEAPAWWSMLPEADHNEIVGWANLSDHFSVVPLVDRDDHPRVGLRFTLTRELTGERVDWLDPIPTRGEGPLARMLGLAAVSDLVTLDLAERYAVDPASVAVIEELKKLLEEN